MSKLVLTVQSKYSQEKGQCCPDTDDSHWNADDARPMGSDCSNAQKQRGRKNERRNLCRSERLLTGERSAYGAANRQDPGGGSTGASPG